MPIVEGPFQNIIAARPVGRPDLVGGRRGSVYLFDAGTRQTVASREVPGVERWLGFCGLGAYVLGVGSRGSGDSRQVLLYSFRVRDLRIVSQIALPRRSRSTVENIFQSGPDQVFYYAFPSNPEAGAESLEVKTYSIDGRGDIRERGSFDRGSIEPVLLEEDGETFMSGEVFPLRLNRSQSRRPQGISVRQNNPVIPDGRGGYWVVIDPGYFGEDDRGRRLGVRVLVNVTASGRRVQQIPIYPQPLVALGGSAREASVNRPTQHPISLVFMGRRGGPPAFLNNGILFSAGPPLSVITRDTPFTTSGPGIIRAVPSLVESARPGVLTIYNVREEGRLDLFGDITGAVQFGPEDQDGPGIRGTQYIPYMPWIAGVPPDQFRLVGTKQEGFGFSGRPTRYTPFVAKDLLTEPGAGGLIDQGPSLDPRGFIAPVAGLPPWVKDRPPPVG